MAIDPGKVQIRAGIADKLKEHGIDVDQWTAGGWKDWTRTSGSVRPRTSSTR
jgi:hypothetical protein